MKCPVCGGDRNDKEAHARTVALVRAAGLSEEHLNHGGRELVFKDGRRVQLHEQCNACDAKKLDEALK